MSGALVFLISRSFWNVILFRLKRLRQPKYLVGALIGGAYFYLYFYRFLFRGAGTSDGAPWAGLSDLGPQVAALLLFVVVIVFSWLWPSSRATLHFTEAEITWLFPAPLDRRTLIRFKLFKSQLALLFLAFVMTLLTGRFSQGPEVWMRLAGWWIVFSALQLHRLGASFALQRLMERGLADARRRLAVAVTVLALAGTMFLWNRAVPDAPGAVSPASLEDWSEWLRVFLETGPAPWLLLPFRLILQPWLAPDFGSFLGALPPALIILALHYVWVVRAHVSFEEASIALAEKRAVFLAARRAGDLRVTLSKRSAKEPLFGLGPTGFAPIAFFWKDALAAGGRHALRLWFAAGIALLIGAVAIGNSDRWLAVRVGAGTVGFAVFITIFFTNAHTGAQAVRRDLTSVDLLKTFPVPGWQIVLGQLLGAIIGGSMIQCFAIAVTVASVSHIPEVAAIFGAALPLLGLSIALLVPTINVAMMVVPTGMALLLPAWFKSGEQAGSGPEVMGTRLLLLFGQLFVVGLALLPAAILGGAAWIAANLLGAGAWSSLAGGFAAAITLGAEAALGVAWLGWLFDRFDPSSDG